LSTLYLTFFLIYFSCGALVFSLCCALCCASRSEGPTLVHTLVQPVFLLSNHHANTKAGTQVAPLQNSCQL